MTSQLFVVCDVDGVILRTGSCPPLMVPMQAGNGETVLPGTADQPNQYVDLLSGKIVNKLILAPLVTGLLVTGLPSPCEVTIEGETTEVIGGEVTFDFSLPGTYFVEVAAKHHRPCVVEVTQP